jgi:AraC-like DNA-binding protein
VIDVLGEWLLAFRLSGCLYCRLEAGGDWGLSLPAVPTAAFHAVRRGCCRVEVDGESYTLGRGDIALVLGSQGHRVVSLNGQTCVSLFDALQGLDCATTRSLRLGAESADAEMICGGFAFSERPWNPLLDSLPKVVHLGDNGRLTPIAEHALAAAADELGAGRPSSAAVLARLGELIVMEALRTAATSKAHSLDRGLLAGLAEPVVARALAALHAEPAKSFSLDELARAAGASRSALTQRFRSTLGLSPGGYVRKWRMVRASEALRRTDASLDVIAAEAGYQSVPAFAKAFRAEIGLPPGAYRSAPEPAGHELFGLPAAAQ